MNTLAIQGIGFGSSHSNINNNGRPTDKPSKNEPTVLIPKSKYEELRRNAAKGVMAMTIAAAVMGSGTAVTSCSNSDDVPEITAPTDKVDLQTQKTLMNMLGVLGVPVMTNSSNPKIVDKLKLSDIITDYELPFPEETYTYNSDLSDKSKSVYTGDKSDRIEIKSADNGEIKANLIDENNRVIPTTFKTNNNCIDSEYFYPDFTGISQYKKSDKGTGWVSYDGGNGVGDFKMQASAK